VVETELGRIRLVICADTFTDDHFERVRQFNPDLLLVPYGWAAEPSDWPDHSKELEALVTRRAAQIRCPIVGVNLVGQMTHGPWKGRTYGGASLAVDRAGRVLRLLRDRDAETAVVTIRF
jgi:predicted amidohydrolase